MTPGQVVGFDISETAIAQARTQAEQLGLTNLQLDVANIHDVDLPDESFDVAHFSGVLAHLNEPHKALNLAYHVVKPGGLIAAREPQRAGDWFGGPHREVITLLSDAISEDWKAAGGDPFLGRRLGNLLGEAGFERMELTPGYSPALSTRQAIGAFAQRRLSEPEFLARLVRRGWVTAEQLEKMVELIPVWAETGHDIILGILYGRRWLAPQGTSVCWS